MINNETLDTTSARPPAPSREDLKTRLTRFPWWLMAIFVIILFTVYLINTNPNFYDAFNFIKAGITVTIVTTLISYSIAIVLGLFTSLGRISKNIFWNNLTTLYVEVIRGIPMLVLIFFIALVGMPAVLELIPQIGARLSDMGLISIGKTLTAIKPDSIPMNARAITALSITYGAYSSEIFRAGIQSIAKGQMEAARSQGMSYRQAMQHIILPQAIRNVLPAIGNDFISMLKDSSLVSILAVRDITQIARLYAGRTFQFRESYFTLSIMYLVMTLLLSFLVKYIEKRLHKNEHS